MPLTDDLCPLGFAPHSVRPTRCKRCFRDYNDHKPKKDTSSKLKEVENKASLWEKRKDSRDSFQFESDVDTKKPSTTKLTNSTNDYSDDFKAENVATTSLASTSTSSAVVRRRRDRGNSIEEPDGADGGARSRTRVRPHSIATTDEVTGGAEKARSLSPNDDFPRRASTSSSEGEDRERRRSRRIQILSAYEVTPATPPGESSDELTSPDVAFILQVKTSTSRLRDGDEEDTVSIAPTDTTETTLTLGDTLEDLQSQVQTLRSQLEASEEKFTRLEKQTKEWQESKYHEVDREALERTASELLKLRARVNELETGNQDFKEENNVMKLEVKELQEELDKRPSPEEVERTIDELRNKLVVTESLYEELMDENEDFKREIRDLEDEIEELQDNFREDQADEYSILRKELEQTAKNCRILQFKLRKAEKRCDQLDVDKTQYEDKLKELIKAGHLDVNQAEKLNHMEQELSTARDTSNQMHSEMESLQNKLKQLQEEKDILSKKKAADGSTTPVTSRVSSPVTRVQSPDARVPSPIARVQSPDARVPSPVARVPSPVARRETKDGRGKDISMELDPAQLLRDLYDTMERENDLKEQLRFTEEEAENFRKKMSFLEQENETLALQIKKMATTAKRSKDRPPSREGNYDDDSGISDDPEELSHSELKLHLELNEQETSVLRRKVEELEVENIALQKEVRELQEKVEEKPKTVFDLPAHPPADPAQANIFYEQKVKMLEVEAKELRMKLIDKDRENERLSSELMFKQRKGSKTVMTRSRSLDSDVQIDLKRQLQLVEQEASILRQKMIELENENDTLSAENKTLQLKAGKKGPLSPQEKLQAENMHLQSRIAKLEKKLTESQESAANAGSVSDITATNLLKSQLKQQEEEMHALKATLETLRSENDKLNIQLKLFNNKGELVIKKRKKIPDLAPKQEFKKALEELEVEVNQLSTVVQAKEEKNKTLTTDFQEQVKTVKRLQEEVKENEKKFKTQLMEVEKKNEKLSKNLDEEKKKVDNISKTLKDLEDNKKKASLKKDDVSKYEKKIESLQKDLDEERLKTKDPKSKLSAVESSARFEDLRRVEEEKHKLQKQILDHQRMISESDKRIAELEQTNKDAEKIHKNLKREIEDLTKELDKEKNNLKKVDNRQTEVATAWLRERDEMKKQILDLQKKAENLEKEVEAKNKKISDQDDKMLDGDKKRDAIHTSLKQREDDLKHVKENNSKLKSKLKELEEKFVKVDHDMQELTDKWRKLDLLYKKEKEDWMAKQIEFEADKKVDVKKLERMEKEHETDLKDRDEEMIRLKDRLRKMDLEIKSKGFREEVTSVNPQLQTRVNALEEELENEKREYEDLTSKYEMLEEEHVVTKAKLVMEKEGVESNLQEAQKEYQQLDGELKTLRDTFNLRQDTWIREKLDMQEKIKDLDEKLSRSNSLDWEYEMDKINQKLAEKNTVIDQQRREEKQLKDEVEKLRRQSEDLRSKLADFERSRTFSRFGTDLSPSSQKELQELKNNLMKAEIEELRTKLQQEEKVHRSEVTALKMMTDVKIAQMQDDFQMLHIQTGKFRRERDTFKEMLEGAQRTIGDLKSDTIRRRESFIGQETEELKEKLQNLRKVVDTLQDQLDNSERTNSHLKTEYVTEKASWEIKIAEMQTKVNELEESTILQGGKSKIIGVKTKLELAWQKEREEQQRLLHESHRMAKELRQRVIDLENARDKERTEAKRQLEDLRKTVEADQAETQIKISELQADLLELRDAHSKMRTTNDRIKREREKLERERDELKMKLGQNQQSQSDDITTITGLVAELEKLKKLIPTILEQQRPISPSKLGKTLVDAAAVERAKEEVKNVLNKIAKATEELRRAHGVREEERVRRNLSFRRALSATDSDLEASKPPVPVRLRKDDPLSRWQNPQRVTNYPASPPSMLITPPRLPSYSTLHRKSLSLDQSLTWEQMEQTIWKSDSEAGSSSSLQEPNAVHNRSHSSGGEYATLEVPQSGPSPLPRRKKRLQSSLTSLESSAASSRDASVEKDAKAPPPPRPPSPNVEANRASTSSMTLPKTSKDTKGSSSLAVKDKFRMFGKSKSTDIEDKLGSRYSASSDLSGSLKLDKPKDFKTKISNIFRKPPSRTSSLDSEKDLPTTTSVNSTLTEKLKSLKPVRDSKQYRSTGALHTKLNSNQAANESSPESPYSTSSLSRRFLKKFHVRSKSMDEPSYANTSTTTTGSVVEKVKTQRIETQV